jgi:glycerate kinase
MALKVLVVPDKFKGTLSAADAALAMARGWRQLRPQDKLRLLPMSDGGDGFGEVLGSLCRARVQKLTTVDAAGRPCKVSWWYDARTKTAIIESAKVVGLAMLPPGRFHPFELDTFGLGRLLRSASVKGAQRCLVGIGGSATNDGGFGLARALGWQFLDRERELIKDWTKLANLAEICPGSKRLFRELIVAVDVDNPLLGRRGCSRIYGPQKGLLPKDMPVAESNLRRLAVVTGRKPNQDFSKNPGAGAAGGLGFGLMAFLGARAEKGFEVFARYSALRSNLKWADVVLTGEGRIDRSTAMGKGVGQIATLSSELAKPCMGLAGELGDTRTSCRGFSLVLALSQLAPLAEAKAEPAIWLERAASLAAAKCCSNPLAKGRVNVAVRSRRE